MLLEKINSPEDLKALPDGDIPALCGEIREFLVEKVTEHGGHLASNLGIVELTLALHKVFDCPRDKIIFDVGHQSYVHKLITGRREGFDGLRSEGGISGFTKTSESDYDVFGAGHSSTSLSAALGFASAAKLKGDDGWAVAVIGDGAFTGGMIYEALNNCEKDLKLMIILNENEMSISANVGRFSKYISEMRSSKKYISLKRGVADTLRSVPLIGKGTAAAVNSVKEKFKSVLVKDSTFFEKMGLRYFGPVDGNDYEKLKFIIQSAKNGGGSCIVHITTKKGMGYAPAMNDPRHWHAVAPKNEKKPGTPSFSAEFGRVLCKFASHDEKICAVTAAMCDGTGLTEFSEKYPERFFDVGIAEEHAVTFCAGLSAAGMKPVFAVYSSFLQRAYDNLIHDVAIQKLNLTLAIDRAGLSEADGITHHGIYDVAFLSQISGSLILCPVALKSVEPMLTLAASKDGICAVRYPKGYEDRELTEAFYKNDEDFRKIGLKIAYPGENCKYVFISYGRAAIEALHAAQRLNAEEEGCACAILMENISPRISVAEKLNGAIPENAVCVFSEEGIKNGGAGMYFAAALSERFGRRIKVLAVESIPDRADTAESFYKMCGIDSDSLIAAAKGEK